VKRIVEGLFVRVFANVGIFAACVVLASACGGGSGDDGSSGSPGPADLSTFETDSIRVDGVDFEVWIADTDAKRARGFMFATAEQLAPLADGTPRGMLFVYPEDRQPQFFMRDTFVPLDLAFARADGTIVEVHRLEPLDETRVPASQPVRFALEAMEGTFAERGIGVGDRIDR
jgi:uncharacterized membrane protein (UPF0127 family)